MFTALAQQNETCVAINEADEIEISQDDLAGKTQTVCISVSNVDQFIDALRAAVKEWREAQ